MIFLLFIEMAEDYLFHFKPLQGVTLLFASLPQEKTRSSINSDAHKHSIQKFPVLQSVLSYWLANDNQKSNMCLLNSARENEKFEKAIQLTISI